jgi:hypothetical protein
MFTGTGIFLGASSIAIVLLYAATKDWWPSLLSLVPFTSVHGL